MKDLLSYKSFNHICKKLNLDSIYTDYLAQLLNGLATLGYISNRDFDKYIQIIDSNVKNVIISNETTIEFKTGHYDARKKEIYIKNYGDKETFFHRMIYALTTKSHISGKIYMGYNKIYFDEDTKNFEHHNFSLNRAIVTDITLNLLNLYGDIKKGTNYERSILSNIITTDHNTYFLENYLFNQLCISLNINSTEFCKNLFSKNPIKFIERIESKYAINTVGILKIFDDISRTFSHYNKITYFESLAKNINDRNESGDIDASLELERELKLVSYKINDIMEKYEFKYATIEDLKKFYSDNILEGINKYQNAMVDILLETSKELEPFYQAAKLKEFDRYIVNPNPKLDNAIYEVIQYKVLSQAELTSTNLIEGIKFDIILNLIESTRYGRIYKNFYFQIIESISNHDTIYLMLISDNMLVDIYKINHFEKQENKIDNLEKIHFDDIEHLIINDKLGADTFEYNQVYHHAQKHFNNKKLFRKDVILLNIDSYDYCIVSSYNQLYFCSLNKILEKNCYEFKLLELSEKYYVVKNLKETNETSLSTFVLPNNLFSRIFSIFKIGA